MDVTIRHSYIASKAPVSPVNRKGKAVQNQGLIKNKNTAQAIKPIAKTPQYIPFDNSGFSDINLIF